MPSVLSTLPKEYGYVIATGTISYFMLQYMVLKVVMARKKYKIKYPIMYSEDQPVFNCVQRVHANTLESYPSFLFFLLTSGLRYPRAATGCGMLWILSRFLYSIGYSTGNPEKRHYGAFGFFPFAGLVGMTIKMTGGHLGWWSCC
ncbi:microsomal glutathione S-transferase 3-like isoform X2 [Anneissia japonica]|nr:microsomal glutathione S-transferase 3-like isoform X2 [Anneissia japonica]